MALAGASVTVLEAGRIGGGTSSCSFAWTNSNAKTPRAYHELNVAGMKTHAALADEFGAAPWWHGGGSVEWVRPSSARRSRRRSSVCAPGATRRNGSRPRQLLELEPDIDAGSDRRCADRLLSRRGLAGPGGLYRCDDGCGASRTAPRSSATPVCRNRSSRGGRITGVKTADDGCSKPTWW